MSFIELVTTEGESTPEFLLYRLRGRDAGGPQALPLSGWPAGSRCSHYLLEEPEWGAVIDLFTLRPASNLRTADPGPLLSEALSESLTSGGSAAWLMFDGAFVTVDSLFGDWESERTYGLALPGQEPALALEEAERASARWRGLTRSAGEIIRRRISGS